MKLVIVESPTKARTLSRFLGSGYQTMASMGHIRDLPKKELGIDVDNDFKPLYVEIENKKEIITELQKTAKKASQIILATDPDREGEAIAYHIRILCSRAKSNSSLTVRPRLRLSEAGESKRGREEQRVKFIRIVFHEITKEALNHALKNPTTINMRLVDAQQARRVLDRLVGYKLSPLLWRKIRLGLSAGRVQSVVVRLIVEREREIKKFTAKRYWTINVGLQKLKTSSFSASLYAKNNQPYEKTTKLKLFVDAYTYKETSILAQKQAQVIVADLKKQKFVITEIKSKDVFRLPGPPFITSTLQQAAARSLGFSSKLTMQLAQKLYENGLITYHRTDSTALASQAVIQMREYIKATYKDKYLPEAPRVFKTSSKSAQEAHEAIRPTHIAKTSQEIKGKLSQRHLRLYRMIRQRALACQMASSLQKQTSLVIKAGPYELRAGGVKIVFDGFLKLYPSRLRENILPDLQEKDELKPTAFNLDEHETSAPPRYNEASLIKTLEAKGIGRPSTYAPVISVVQTRQYVEKKDGVFYPTPVGETVNDFLVKYFKEIMEIPFTAQMEDDLDQVALGKKKWPIVIKEFYHPFAKILETVMKKAQRAKIEPEKIGKKCPQCKEGEQVIRLGRFGKFISCSKFPACKWKAPFIEKIEGAKCEQCGSDIVVRKTKKGKRFYGCSKWPECKWASWKKPQPAPKK